jgi:chorismate mutase
MEHQLTIKKSPLLTSSEGPLIISGPCSAETAEQLMETALQLKKLNRVHVLRAGIWKPRTRPGAFEGIGSIGLEWLSAAKAATGFPTAVEIANVKHVEEALKSGVDILWIGARTTVNPFAVQDIADALVGVDVPVLVKNPINPDLELWIGALERLNRAGITQLGAIHRGFSSYEKTKYRNKPNWEIPIELRRRIPQLPIINDPSHICGNREMLLSVAQTAMDMNFDGLMLESHINPAEAWSDAKQQVTPADLNKILNQLVLRKSSSDDAILLNVLEELREKIDQMDTKIITMLSKRMKIAKKIGKFKKEKNVTILQSDRWEEIVQSRLKFGTEKKLSENFVTKLFEIIHQESIDNQNLVMNKGIKKNIK